jgi:hypothetical protein
VRQDVAAADYEDEVEAREDLLSGLAAYSPASGSRHGTDLGLGSNPGEVPTYEPELETYESPLYGYTVTYDSITWHTVGEDGDPDDVYDLIEFSNGVSFFAVWGDPDYDEDEMADCVADYVGFLEQLDGVVEIETYDGPDAAGQDDDRAWETVTYVWEFRDGVAPVYGRYFECIWLGDGVTAVVIHEANLVSYDAELPYREALVDGIEPAND